MNKKLLKQKLRKTPVVLTPKDIEKIKRDATKSAVESIYLIPLLVLKDKFGYGGVRLKRYLDEFNELMDSYNKGYLDLKDIEETLLKENKMAFIRNKDAEN